jgi:flagellar hook-basal body complex protein FliE
MNKVSEIQGIPTGTPEVRKPSDNKGSNSFSEVLNNVFVDAAKIQNEAAKSIEQVPLVSMADIKIEMAKAGDAMQRMEEARDKLLSAYKTMNENQ